MTDAERIDFLERTIKHDGPLLLHDTTGSDSPELKGYRGRGLGLIPWRPRSLQDAIDSMAGVGRKEDIDA